MRRMKPVILTLLILLAALLLASPARADGIIIPDPPICDLAPCPPPFPFPHPISQLAIEYHRVEVTIQDQVAVTRVDQVFRNDNSWVVEGMYIFPLPAEAAVDSFSLWMDNEPVEGKVLTREEARRIYEEIVRTLRDPALLEYVDRGAVQASIFPIQPGESRRIELEYTQVLAADQGLIHYRYPLNTEKFSTDPLEEVSISIEVSSDQPVRAIYSPSHQVSIDRADDQNFSVGYEDLDVKPDKDFDLFYSISQEDFGLNLLTFRDRRGDDGDGFFLLLAAPSIEVSQDERIAKDLLFVLDRSGSMEGEKFRQAQAALRYVLDHLNDEDRFNIIAFSNGTEPYANRLRPASEAGEAKRWVDSLAAEGSTDIHRALLEAIAMVDEERATILIFLTDGLPTAGVTETDMILKEVLREAPSSVRLFAFGVGYDVDTFLLDSLAQAQHGTTTYVTPDQAIDESVSGFYAKVSTPVLTDIELDFGDLVTYDLHPEPLPDLFAGGQLVLVGRYRSSGTTTIRLAGNVEGRRVTFEYDGRHFISSGGPDFLPRLWATRKIGSLLNQIRLEGPNQELVEQIVELSIRYGIVTPYTSYLVTEPEALSASAREAIAGEAFKALQDSTAPAFGQEAVERAAAESDYAGAGVALEPSGEAAEVVRVVGSRTFRLSDGVWVDTGFDREQMSTSKVPFLSDDYFALATSRPDVAAALALGERVIVIVEGEPFEVVGAEEDGDSITLPPARPQDEGSSGDSDPGLGPDGPVENPRRPARPRLACPGAALALGLMALSTGIRRPRAE